MDGRWVVGGGEMGVEGERTEKGERNLEKGKERAREIFTDRNG